MIKNIAIILKGKKVSLAVPKKEDIEAWFIGFNDPDISIPLGTSYKMFTLEEREKFYLSLSDSQKNIFFSIIDNSTGNSIGYIKFNQISHFHKRAYFSTAIFDKNSQGKGFGTEAIRLFLDYSFRIQGLRKLVIRHYDFNESGSHVYKKIGFKQVGVLKQDCFVNGEYRDRVILEIFKDEFYELNKDFL